FRFVSSFDRSARGLDRPPCPYPNRCTRILPAQIGRDTWDPTPRRETHHRNSDRTAGPGNRWATCPRPAPVPASADRMVERCSHLPMEGLLHPCRPFLPSHPYRPSPPFPEGPSPEDSCCSLLFSPVPNGRRCRSYVAQTDGQTGKGYEILHR